MAETQTTNGQNESSPPQASQNPQGSQQSQLARTPQSGMSRSTHDPFASYFGASPFSLMRRMSEEMDRMFGNFGFPNFDNLGGRSPWGSNEGWSPAIEVAERDGKYVVHAELPGLKQEDVKVELNGDQIVIQGERRSRFDDEKGGIRRSERQYGQFYRSIPLPEGIDAEKVQATFNDGILEVSVPMPRQQSNRRQIPVSAQPAVTPAENRKH